jgi:hypothetical protein
MLNNIYGKLIVIGLSLREPQFAYFYLVFQTWQAEDERNIEDGYSTGQKLFLRIEVKFLYFSLKHYLEVRHSD